MPSFCWIKAKREPPFFDLIVCEICVRNDEGEGVLGEKSFVGIQKPLGQRGHRLWACVGHWDRQGRHSFPCFLQVWIRLFRAPPGSALLGASLSHGGNLTQKIQAFKVCMPQTTAPPPSCKAMFSFQICTPHSHGKREEHRYFFPTQIWPSPGICHFWT